MIEEIWKIYKNGESYIVSNLGNIFNLHKKILMKQQIDRYGYKYVSLTLNGKKIKKKVHRMVCEAFLPNPENKPQVNHKNGVRSDNRLENLEWATPRENMLHSFRILSADGHLQKAMSERRKGIKPKPESAKKSGLKRKYGANGRAIKVICIETNQIFSCQKEAAEKCNISLWSVCESVKNGKSIKGLHFKRCN